MFSHPHITGFLVLHLFLHCFFRFLHCGNCSFLHRDTAVLVVAELNDHGIICDIDHGAVKPACCQYGITDCKFIAFFFFASFCCGRIMKKYMKPNKTTNQIIIPPQPAAVDADEVDAKIDIFSVPPKFNRHYNI